MCPTWVMFLVFIIILYTLKSSKVKICGIPLGIVFAVVAVSYYVYMNKRAEHFTSDRKIRVYNFNTTWCGWSKNFQPEWDKFTDMMNSKVNDAYDIKDIKCDNIENDPKLKALAKQYKVMGYPHIAINIDDNISTYKGERKAQDLYDYVQKL
jgi:thiol-disulfide isomerase/thioredoxin